MVLVLEKYRRVYALQKKEAIGKFRKIIKLYRNHVSQCRIWLIRKNMSSVPQHPSNLRNTMIYLFPGN